MDEPKQNLLPEDLREEELSALEEALLADDSWDERDEEALADLDAGRFISHEAMVRWMESLGTENELPPPECGM